MTDHQSCFVLGSFCLQERKKIPPFWIMFGKVNQWVFYLTAGTDPISFHSSVQSPQAHLQVCSGCCDRLICWFSDECQYVSCHTEMIIRNCQTWASPWQTQTQTLHRDRVRQERSGDREVEGQKNGCVLSLRHGYTLRSRRTLQLNP